ncbi:SLAIN motif-containing protein 1-like isoform X1 [Takifugu flavidus]|uniref:SLAIN motif-containing protein 1-like isoform X1 n=1 Tax=Takifugu flavidus TaxID=433684 RepID=UPI002544CAA9|nr:SLAIN motif-containing protein 1-like isoform X1 [Takifugu flavidus]
MPEVDLKNNSLNTEVEVKKLQDLVRKLEWQNEQLRSRAGPYALPATGGCRLSSPEETIPYFLAHTDESEMSILDELELLDLSSLSCLDESEETWLYTSSKSPDNKITPLQWCRQVLDQPRSEVSTIAGPISLRQEPAALGRGSFCSPSPCSPGPALLRTSCSTPQASEKLHAPPLLCSPRHPTLQHSLSPVRRELLPSPARRTPTMIPHNSKGGSVSSGPLSPQLSVDCGLGSSDIDDSMVQGYKLQDLMDVQVMARLQEENLRAHRYSSFINPLRCVCVFFCVCACACVYVCSVCVSINPARLSSSVLPTGLRRDLVRSSFAGRHSRSFGFQSSFLSGGSGLEEGDEDKDHGLLLQRPRLLATLLPHSQTFNSIRDFRPRSPTCPHSASSAQLFRSGGSACQDQALGQRLNPGLGSGIRLGTAGLQDFRPGLDALRRSMPNLVRVPSTPCVPSLTHLGAAHCCLRNSQSFDSSAGLLRRPSSILLQNRVHSVDNVASLSSQLSKATAYVSPTIKGSSSSAPSTPRSSLPRPASSAGTSPTPRNRVNQSASKQQPISFMTPPKTLRDTSRRERCY